MFSRLVIFSIFLFAIFSRFYSLNWGDGLFFHPDENNMASSVSSLAMSNLDPKFFAYGQFPLYLAFFTGKIINYFNNINATQISFSASIYILRFYSAIFSLLSVLLIYKISKYFIKKKNDQLILVLLTIFSPGLIQLSHFGTTESILIFVFLGILYFSLKIFENKNNIYKNTLFIAVLLSVGISSKIISIIFVFPYLITLLFLFKDHNFKIKILINFIILLVLTSFLTAIFSPYNIISINDFISTMAYETSVANGSLPVFYTRQFTDTIPYFFQIVKVFPFALGIPVFIISLFGIFFYKKNKEFYILLIPFLIYFLYTGQLFVKWFRFSSPIFPFFIIFASIFISKIKNVYIKSILVLICILPGIIFLNNNYLKPSTRLQSTIWINKNIPENSVVLSEARNVFSIPLINNKNIKINNFELYDIDENETLKNEFDELVNNSDYIFVPSRRIYKNHTKEKFPKIYDYYESLFNGNLGYKKVAEFNSNVSWPLDSNEAEETFSVFDSPKIMIYKKNI